MSAHKPPQWQKRLTREQAVFVIMELAGLVAEQNEIIRVLRDAIDRSDRRGTSGNKPSANRPRSTDRTAPRSP